MFEFCSETSLAKGTLIPIGGNEDKGIEKSEINLEKAKVSANFAQIKDFIEKLPNQYLQKVGETGLRLSGGQRQRIEIARALYRGANIIILDEPTNALDKDTENLVMDSVFNLEKDITLIMVSHSNRSLVHFDQVIDFFSLTSAFKNDIVFPDNHCASALFSE